MMTVDDTMTDHPAAGPSELTPRERIVLAALAENTTLDEVAASLWVSRNTVKTQLRSIYRKLGVSTREQAKVWAERMDSAG